MYETNFGFKDRPFTVSPSPACFFQAAEHQNVLDELLVTISSLNGITILTGDPGTGKTAICRQIIFQLEDQFQIQFIEHCNFPTVRALLQTLLYGLTDCYEKVSEQELRLALNAEIRSSFLAHEQPLLVIVDEAHLLKDSFLEELRVLSDISIDGKPALQLLLCGQTTLEETLIQPALSSLNQRIGCQVFLDRMTRQESEEYIEYRIKRVTTEERAFFTEDASKFITQVSDGLPRCLNQICDHSLMLAYVQDSPIVDESIAREAFTDLQQLPLHWNDPLPVSSPLEELRKDDWSEKSALISSDDVSAEYEIDALMEEQLNELSEAVSSKAEINSDDFDWDSSDLLSSGDDIEAIEIGSSSETGDTCAAAEPVVESVGEFEIDDIGHVELSQTSASVEEQTHSTMTTDGFVEIIDRYAAIDAGIDPATLPHEPQQKSAILRQGLRLQPPQFQAPAKSFTTENQASIPQDSDAESSDAFSDTQLNQSNQNVFQALEHEISEGEETFEELLAAQIFEVCAETRKGLLNALNEIRNYSEPAETKASEEDSEAYDVVEPDYEAATESEVAHSWEHSPVSERVDQPAAAASFRVDSRPDAREEQQSATSHLKGPAFGRYKNLFSRLRRKQGLS